MNFEQTIKTAIEFEIKIRDLYRTASERVAHPVGKRILQRLAEDETLHVDFLQKKLTEWVKNGKVACSKLASVIPAQLAIKNTLKEMKITDYNLLKTGDELQILAQAFEMEQKALEFYKTVIKELQREERWIFTCILDIEQTHELIVKSQLDSVTQTGIWLDIFK